MVCSLGSGRMKAMARLLAAGSFSQTITEEVTHQKLAAQYIHRELREADEANLLDEEDMHVFGLKPMTDPLHLVCCNACKKPVKASQYAAHAELCKSLSSAEEIVMELDGGTGHRRPPRKERKKLLTAYANQAMSVGEQERFESLDANDFATSESYLDEQIQLTSSVSMEAKRNSSFVGGASIMDGSGVSPGNTEYSAGAKPRPTKRSKMIAAEGLLIADHLETANGVTKSTHGALTFREYPGGSSTGSEKTCDHNLQCQLPGQVHDCCLPSKDLLVPLATKMFYSQRSVRLRSAISHLYYKASTEEHCGDLVNPKLLQRDGMPSRTSSPNNFCPEQIDDQQEKRDKHSLPSVQKPDQILAQNSEVYSSKSGGCPQTMNSSNQFPLNNILRPHTAPVGMIRNNYLSNPYSFPGNSGKPLGNIQQSKGSVPVV